MKVPRDAIQDFLYWFDPNAPTEDQILQVLMHMAQDMHDIKIMLEGLTVSLGGNISTPISNSINQTTNPIPTTFNISALLSINFPPWLYPTQNSIPFYERNAINVVGVISNVVTSQLIVQVTVPTGYVGFLYRIATDDNTSSFHQYIIDGVPDNQYSGTASPQGTEPMLTLFPPLRFNKSIEYYASNFNNSTVTYQGIFIGWFTPSDEV